MVQGPGGTRREVDNQGKTRGFEGNGKVARFDPRGRPQYVHDERRGVTISRGPGGERNVMRQLPDGRRVVSTGNRFGYVEHRYVPGRGAHVVPGRSYVQRTYVVNNVRYTRVYATYSYRGVPYYRYAPFAYYRPAYYHWAFTPWPRPIVFGWGWGGSPWFGFYAGYFAPAPYYPVASLWLADYLLAENLRAAYEARAAAQAEAAAPPPPPAPAGEVTLTPEVKQLIAQEVQAQLAEQQAAAAQAQQAAPVAPAPAPAPPPPSGAPMPPPPGGVSAPGDELPPALSPKHRVFIVSSSLSVVADGQECALTPGDVITRLTDNPDENNLVRVDVLSSKPGDCASGLQVAVAVQDLQEMYNSFRERLDSGLKTLASNSGKSGMPAAPDTSTVTGEVTAPPPDQDAENMLKDEQKVADQSESELLKEAMVGQGG